MIMYQCVCSLVLLYICTYVCFFIWFENRIIKWIEIMWSIKPNLNPRLLMSFSFIIALLGIIVISIMLWFLGFSALAFSPDILYFMLLVNLTLLWSDFFFFFSSSVSSWNQTGSSLWSTDGWGFPWLPVASGGANACYLPSPCSDCSHSFVA